MILFTVIEGNDLLLIHFYTYSSICLFIHVCYFVLLINISDTRIYFSLYLFVYLFTYLFILLQFFLTLTLYLALIMDQSEDVFFVTPCHRSFLLVTFFLPAGLPTINFLLLFLLLLLLFLFPLFHFTAFFMLY